jgi:hypothetical protein
MNDRKTYLVRILRSRELVPHRATNARTVVLIRLSGRKGEPLQQPLSVGLFDTSLVSPSLGHALGYGSSVEVQGEVFVIGRGVKVGSRGELFGTRGLGFGLARLQGKRRCLLVREKLRNTPQLEGGTMPNANGNQRQQPSLSVEPAVALTIHLALTSPCDAP